MRRPYLSAYITQTITQWGFGEIQISTVRTLNGQDIGRMINHCLVIGKGDMLLRYQIA